MAFEKLIKNPKGQLAGFRPLGRGKLFWKRKRRRADGGGSTYLADGIFGAVLDPKIECCPVSPGFARFRPVFYWGGFLRGRKSPERVQSISAAGWACEKGRKTA
jgi:hypothetical protein